MDFRMDKSSWVMIALMLITFFYFIVNGHGELSAMEILKVALLALFVLVALLAIVSIPVLVICYFIKKIPDIDYSIRAAFVFSVIGIISELI